MRRIGFSTGALAKGDFDLGLELQASHCTAVELSSLREEEIDRLVEALPTLDLSRFEFVSFHAPSKREKLTEAELVGKLERIKGFVQGIIVHPDLINDASLWRSLGDKVIIENMDQRKPIGRTAEELRPYFEVLPKARFCLDLGHAHQVDPTQAVTIELLKQFGSRLAELHISEVDTFSKHVAISASARTAFRRLASLFPADVPVIIESVVEADEIEEEIAMAKESVNAETEYVRSGRLRSHF
jgi:hypothetical protein